MKFWELLSIFRGSRRSILALVLADERWGQLRAELDRIDQIVNHQDRRCLDQELPAELVTEALQQLDFKFAINKGRIRMTTESDDALSAVEIARKYGDSVIEEIMEYGSAPISG